MDKVDVVIPTIWRESLVRSVNSVLNQTIVDNINKILIVGSKIETENQKRVFETVKNMDKVEVVDFVEFGYAGYKRDIAIREHSKSRLIALIDDDDEWYPEKLEKQLSGYNGEDYWVSWTGMDFIDMNSGKKLFSRTECPNNLEDIYLYNFIPTSSVVFTRKLYFDSGGYQYHMFYLEDWDLNIRMLGESPVTHCVPEPLIKYYVHPGQTGSSRMYEYYKILFDTYFSRKSFCIQMFHKLRINMMKPNKSVEDYLRVSKFIVYNLFCPKNLKIILNRELKLFLLNSKFY